MLSSNELPDQENQLTYIYYFVPLFQNHSTSKVRGNSAFISGPLPTIECHLPVDDLFLLFQVNNSGFPLLFALSITPKHVNYGLPLNCDIWSKL